MPAGDLAAGNIIQNANHPANIFKENQNPKIKN
jgi:hypothetical protein